MLPLESLSTRGMNVNGNIVLGPVHLSNNHHLMGDVIIIPDSPSTLSWHPIYAGSTGVQVNISNPSRYQIEPKTTGPAGKSANQLVVVVKVHPNLSEAGKSAYQWLAAAKIVKSSISYAGKSAYQLVAVIKIVNKPNLSDAGKSYSQLVAVITII